MRWWIALLALAALSCGSPAAPSAAFTGRWSGTYLVTQCTPSGWLSCTGLIEEPSHTYTMTLTLTQSGANVSGSLEIPESSNVGPVQVTGTASRDTLTVGGTATTQVLNRFTTMTVRIVRWTTARDGNNKLTGTFAFRVETLGGSASIAPRPGEIWTADYEAQLVNVVPQP